MSRIVNDLTGDEIRGLYEYRVAKRLIRDEFPFIKDIDIEETKLNEYNLIFLNIKVEPFEVAEYYDLEPYWGLIYQTIMNPSYRFSSPFLATFVQNPPTRFSMDFDDEVDDILASVHSSNVIQIGRAHV